MKKAALSLMLVALLGGLASAEMIAIDAVEDGGYVLNDVSVNTAGAPWLSSLIYVELDSGAFYQHPQYTGDFLWSYVDFGTGLLNPIDSWLAPSVKPFASADELADLPIMSGDPGKKAVSLTFLADVVIVDGQEVVPPWDGLAARFAFSPGANGVWALQVGTKEDGEKGATIYTGDVVDGVMVIPEPGTIALLLCGLLGLCVLRRK